MDNEDYIANISRQLENENPWNVFKSFKRGKGPPNNIKAVEWTNHFNKLLNKPNSDLTNNLVISVQPQNDVNTDLLNDLVTLEEVNLSVTNLKNGKSSGPDGLPGEFFKKL